MGYLIAPYFCFMSLYRKHDCLILSAYQEIASKLKYLPQEHDILNNASIHNKSFGNPFHPGDISK